MSAEMKISGVRPEKPELPVSSRGRVEQSGKDLGGNSGADARKTAKEAGGTILSSPADIKTPPNRNPAETVPRKMVLLNRENNSPVSNSPPSNSSSQSQISQAAAEASGGQAVPARELFKQSAASLGFPRDILSVTLLAAGRFFSLPPGAAFLGKLRRELLASLKSTPPENAEEKTALETKALAAAAAFDKGVVLSPEALERYARFFDFPAPENTAPEGKAPDIPPPDSDSEGMGRGGSGAGKGGGGNPSGREENPSAEELRAVAEEEAGKDGLLDFLNAVPGKNGQYWQVFPFKLSVRGIELTVFIRILKRGLFVPGETRGPAAKRPGIPGEAERIIADISGPKREWRFFLEKKAGKLRADIRVYPAMPPKALNALRKEAERFLGKGNGFGGFEEILVRNAENLSSWADDLAAQPPVSVDREI